MQVFVRRAGRRVLVLLGVVAVCALLMAPFAFAITIGVAGRDADAMQSILCLSNGQGGCANPSAPWPNCILWDAAAPAYHIQWVCLGGVVFNNRRVCSTEVWLDPYGVVLLYTLTGCS